MVVQEVSHKPETLQYADVVLPAASWAEKEGTMTNAERRVSYLNKITDAPGEALPDAEIICRFAQKMGFAGFDYNHVSEIFAEHAALTRGTHIDISALNYNVLREKLTVQWPYTAAHANAGRDNEASLGTKRLFTDHQFYTVSKKAIIHSFDDLNRSEPLSPDFPLILTTGRIRDQWHTMSKTGKVNKLKQHISSAFLEIHPDDALQRGIQENALVVIKSSRGEVQVKAKLSEDIKKGVVFLPMHWGKVLNSDLNRANNVTNNLLDPKSKEPDFKFTAVEVSLYKKPEQKIIVVGAGAGACGFVKSYRNINTEDEIEVFSKEAFPFYNRVLLPDYITGTLQWDNLVKMTDAEEYAYQVKLHRGISITDINRNDKTVTDSNGSVHAYDILILATGSRSAMLRDVPDMKGIFSMRNRGDADTFLQHTRETSGRVVIIGGGLLGIELAAALREVQMEATVIQRTSRLMNRQLDPLGSQLLHEELTDKGIDIYYNDETDRFLGTGAVSGIRLKSGLTIDCTAVVMAIGTTPNIELARESGLECKRGVVVNDYLQTSDPSIFAIGEIAEF